MKKERDEIQGIDGILVSSSETEKSNIKYLHLEVERGEVMSFYFMVSIWFLLIGKCFKCWQLKTRKSTLKT